MDAITLKFELEADDPDAFYPGALTNIKATVFRSGKEIGTIGGIEVDRQKIGENSFHATFDEHSGDLEWVGSTLLENRYGRTRLQSLRDGGDDPEFGFLYLETFSMDKEVSVDVATWALRKFLRSERVKGNLEFDCWSVSSVAYAISGYPGDDEAARTGKRKRGDDEEGRGHRELIPFLRNGFFQDPAIVRGDPDNARILVGTKAHFEKDLLTESQANAKAGRMIKAGGREKEAKKSSRDVEILDLVRKLAEDNFQRTVMQGISSRMLGMSPPVSSRMLGMESVSSGMFGMESISSRMLRSEGISGRMPGTAPAGPAEDDCAGEEQLKTASQKIAKLQKRGGSIARSGALHAAIEKNAIEVTKLMLRLDPSSATAKDRLGRTPLMTAAINAGGRLSINGIDDTSVIDSLLNAGASKSDLDDLNMTAYGYFKKNSSSYLQITRYESRHKLTNLEQKLYPPGGPSLGDFAEGRGGSSGLVDYGPEDAEHDREMGRYSNADGDY